MKCDVNSLVSPENGSVSNVTGSKRVELRPERAFYENKHHQDIQRTWGVAFGMVGEMEYAFVSDDNLYLYDPDYWWDPLGEEAQNEQIGGKIGVIQDPFVRYGAPKYLGATTPIEGGSVRQLKLAENGKLYGRVMVFDPELYTQESGPTDMLMVWDAAKLVSAARDNYFLRTQAIDKGLDAVKGTRIVQNSRGEYPSTHRSGRATPQEKPA